MIRGSISLLYVWNIRVFSVQQNRDNRQPSHLVESIVSGLYQVHPSTIITNQSPRNDVTTFKRNVPSKVALPYSSDGFAGFWHNIPKLWPEGPKQLFDKTRYQAERVAYCSVTFHNSPITGKHFTNTSSTCIYRERYAETHRDKLQLLSSSVRGLV